MKTLLLALALAGADVTIAVRNVEAGQKVAADLAAATGNPNIHVMALNLSDLASVEALARAWQGPLHILINNAGVMAIPRSLTQDGFETQFGVNHLGHFALTGLLLPRITDRVVTVSSTAHRMGRIRLDDLNWHRRYSPWLAYGQSKLANLLFTAELARRLTASGSTVRAHAVHPGYSNTHLQGQTGNNFQLVQTPYMPNQMVGDSPFPLWGKPVFLSDSAVAIATAAAVPGCSCRPNCSATRSLACGRPLMPNPTLSATVRWGKSA